MIWRTRIVIFSDANLEQGEYSIGEARIVVKEINSDNFANPKEYTDKHKFVEIFYPKKDDEEVYQYYIRIHDLIDEFIDLICLVGYANAYMTYFISSCPAKVKIGDKFHIALRQVSVSKKLNPIKQTDLDFVKEIDEDSYLKTVLRFFRNGFNATSNEDKLLMYFSALERIAENESDETIKRKCNKCGNEENTGMKATGNFINALLENYGIDKKEAKEIRKLRSKIAHGSGKRNIKFMEVVNEKAGRLEMAIATELSKRLKAQPSNKNNVVVTGLPMFLHQCLAEKDGTFSLIDSRWIAPLQFPVLPNAKKGNTALAGCPLDSAQKPIIDPLAWPEIES